MGCPDPIGIYVHLPWCVSKCPYCDFNSHALRGELPERAYVEALRRDLIAEAGVWPRPVSIGSVFFGGGTPSLFSAAAIADILEVIDARFGLTGEVEITLEANPGSVDAGSFAGFRRAGVNRLSLGVQSFADRQLLRIGRIHGGAQARRAIEIARGAGFENFNIDLMYGQPGQSVAAALADLETALSFSPAHLSWYQLTLEPGTAFGRRPPALPSDAGVDQTESAGQARLADAGLERYEVSAYARPGRRCRHNLNYWRFGDYLGVGAGAHSKCSRPDGRVRRWSKPRQPRRYMAPDGPQPLRCEAETLTPEATLTDFALNALRLPQGVEWSLLERRTGFTRRSLPGAVAAAAARGLLADDPCYLRPTPLGLRFLDDLLLAFAPR